MQRKEAEKLLAALIFDDLDETSKTELMNYLQTDNELRERLADMRMAVKVASDTVQHGPDPVLGKRRLKHLARLARHHRSWPTFFTVPRLAAAAAIFIISALVLTGIQSSSKVRRYARYVPATKYELASVAEKIEPGYTYEQSVRAVEPSDSRSRRTPEITSTTGKYAFDPAVRGPEVGDSIKEKVGDRIKELMDSAMVLQGQTRYDEALGQLESLLVLDPMNNNALIQKQTLEDMINYRRQIEVERKKSKDGIDVLRKTAEASIPYAGDLTYPDRWQYIIASPYRKPEEPLGQGHYAYDPVARGPAVIDRIEPVNGEIEKIGGAQTSNLYDYANLPTKPDSVEKWASGSSFESKPHSGVTISGGDGSYYVGGYRGGGYGGGYGDKNGDGVMSYPYPATGYGGMGGFGAMGGDSGGGSGIMAPSPPGSRYGYYGMGGYAGGGYSSRGVDSGSGIVSGNMPGFRADTYNGNIEFEGKETNLFTSPDAFGIVADGIPATGRIQFQNGIATGITKDGGAIDSFDVVVGKDGAPSPVTVVAGKPVTITGPELTPPPPPARPSQTMKDVSGTTDLPDIKWQTESGGSHLNVEDIKSHEWWAERRSDTYDEVFKKADDELGTKSFHFHSDRAKPPVPEYVEVVEGSRQGDVSTEEEEESTDEYDEKSGIFCAYLRPKDEIKALLGTDYVSSIPADGPAGKEENGRGKVPILGDIPIINRLYSDADIKRPLTDEEEKQIIAHFEAKKSQPGGEPAELNYETIKLKYANPQEVENLIVIDCDFRNLPGTGEPPEALIKALPEDQQIIIFGRKEQREAVKNMIQEMDVPPGESEVDRTSTFIGEDEPDLPPASRFKLVPVNPWVMAERDSLSTFALDVDTASYTLCRRYIRGGFLPPAGAVRMEEFVNYFNYHYPQRTNPTFAVHAEAAPSPFARKEQNLTLLKIGVKARTIGRDQRKAAHLIFVVDASASMDQPDRLPLVQRALGLLVNKLSAVDRVSLITCANEARLHLETVPARERGRIRQAINAIQPAGPTNLLAGLKLGYATARRTFAPKQINHVVLCSDGVANVGQTEAEAVLEEVAADRKQGITITCVGVGYGSYNDAFLEALANQGDGSYMFLDSLRQVHRVFVRQLAATLQTVARDARIQVDFNPHRVRRYRLIGYENRDIEDERFRDDTIDAGEVGSGQCSTALYELELIGRPSADRQEDLGTVFVRYRNVATGRFEEISSRLSSAIVRRHTVESAPRFFLAASAARFAEILRQSEHAQNGNMMDVFRVVEQVSLALPLDRDVRELAELIRKSENLPRSP